jgi:hypothetical protein
MLRLLVAVILVGAVALAATPAAALDYEEPLVPGAFLTVAVGTPEVLPVEGTAVRFRLALEDTELVAPVEAGFTGGAAWVRAGAPGEGRWIPGNQFTGEETGRALWNWGY